MGAGMPEAAADADKAEMPEAAADARMAEMPEAAADAHMAEMPEAAEAAEVVADADTEAAPVVDAPEASAEETELAHEIEEPFIDASKVQDAEIVPEADSTEQAADSDEPSMWSVPQDEFDISNVSGVSAAEPAEAAESMTSDLGSMSDAGFTTSDFTEEPAVEAAAEPEAESDLTQSGDSMPDMAPPDFDISDDEALLNSSIDGSDALADMLSDVPADIPEAIVQSGTRLQAQPAEEAGAAEGEHELALNSGESVAPADFAADGMDDLDLSGFDNTAQDNEDQSMVAGMMDGEGDNGIDFDKQEALDAQDRFVEDMMSGAGSDGDFGNLDDGFGGFDEAGQLDSDEDLGSFTDLPGFDDSAFDEDGSLADIPFDSDVFGADPQGGQPEARL